MRVQLHLPPLRSLGLLISPGTLDNLSVADIKGVVVMYSQPDLPTSRVSSLCTASQTCRHQAGVVVVYSQPDLPTSRVSSLCTASQTCRHQGCRRCVQPARPADIKGVVVMYSQPASPAYIEGVVVVYSQPDLPTSRVSSLCTASQPALPTSRWWGGGGGGEGGGGRAARRSGTPVVVVYSQPLSVAHEAQIRHS